MTAYKRAIKSDLPKVDRHRIKPQEYDDAPELTDEQLAGAVVTEARPVGRPRSMAPKLAVKLRLDPEVLRYFKSGGAGWQTRINDTLVKVARRAAKR
ncbi:BrnA antitoxin family protein [Reyranella sp.]|uniref:BrnA antitoxin family protein n=1 Tax=Reyranella sp. TaxID=1929291 RepID=UPI003D140675